MRHALRTLPLAALFVCLAVPATNVPVLGKTDPTVKGRISLRNAGSPRRS
jgi:hypothetical protein